MFVDENGEETTAMSCGPAPRVRPPYCRTRFLTINDEPSMTQQSDLDQTDVNAIVDRFKRTGQLPNINEPRAQYADVSDLQIDLTTAINRLRETIRTAQEFGENWKPAPEPESPPAPDPAPTTPPAAA